MLSNLDYHLKCNAWVCTMKSNWCRLVDELRLSVMGKANLYMVDLNRKPPYYYTQAIQWT